MKTRRRFTADFKAKVALEAIRGERTISRLASRHQLHPNQITQWKRQAIEKLANVFDDKTADVQADRKAEVTKLAQPKIRVCLAQRLRNWQRGKNCYRSWIDYYNRRRPHSMFDGRTPDEVYGAAEMTEQLAA